jgi:hypothetical protein
MPITAISRPSTSARSCSFSSSVAALVEKLSAIASPEDFGAGGRADQPAKAMTDAEAIAKSESTSAGVRERASSARIEIEKAYLQVHSPTGSAAWEPAAEAAGHAR